MADTPLPRWGPGAHIDVVFRPDSSGSIRCVAYRTTDGYVTIGANNERLWQRLAETLGNPQWITDPRFRTAEDRIEAVDELEKHIEAVTTTRTTDEWLRVLDDAGVPSGPILTYDQALADPQVLARNMVTELSHPVIGPMKTLGTPAKFSDLDVEVRNPAPWLGQHTAEVLREVGADEPQLDELFAQGIAYDAHSEGTIR